MIPLRWHYGDPDPKTGEYMFCNACGAAVWIIEGSCICSGCGLQEDDEDGLYPGDWHEYSDEVLLPPFACAREGLLDHALARRIRGAKLASLIRATLAGSGYMRPG